MWQMCYIPSFFLVNVRRYEYKRIVFTVVL